MRINKQLSLSIVIPAYNEEESLGFVLKNTADDLPKIVRDWEIIIVDDGSTDKTLQIASLFVKKHKRARVISQSNSGFNKAMLTGIRAAKKDYVAYMHAGGQELIRDMVNCIKIMHKFDLVIGIRGKRIDYNLYRVLLSYGCSIAYRILFGITYEDVHWVYIWKTREIKKLRLDPKGGIFLFVESLIKFRLKDLKVGQAPAPYRPRYGGDNKNTSPYVAWLTIISMVRLWWQIGTRHASRLWNK
ncbi:MAG: hypothetical protein UU67_C0044G0004 [Candidatus Daviesbacteria bacterium GW2011_GWB1_41_5]|uniref:Glycosyltransferase 2-like domain-containing protein n=1 Tax=Candidatus Daviesbacteria bacterium GW2011_GWB1_41_5 TaxID=1618429 RepID=A0A0G0WKW0_9BACT|nr:MAG: hypothetical protein UU67_C0044G0004 [Candidatus Daviesbacteria bacterium GW2011_GWB1_41_5]